MNDDTPLMFDAEGYAIVPHVERDLAPLGLARPVVGIPGRGTAWRIEPEGQRRIAKALAFNRTKPNRPPVYRKEE